MRTAPAYLLQLRTLADRPAGGEPLVSLGAFALLYGTRMQNPQLPMVDLLIWKPLSPIARQHWDEAVAAELAQPGQVELVPLVVNSNVLDFCCTSATPRGAALLGSVDGDVVGLTLTEIVASWRRALELIRAYKGVYGDGVARAYLGEEVGHNYAGRILHQIVRTPTGLHVMMTCPP
jgi:hypothetical protein